MSDRCSLIECGLPADHEGRCAANLAGRASDLFGREQVSAREYHRHGDGSVVRGEALRCIDPNASAVDVLVVDRQGLGGHLVRLLDEHWPNSGVNPWLLADLIHKQATGVGTGHTPFALANDDTICLECSVDADVRWHYRDDGLNGETTGCRCEKGHDHE